MSELNSGASATAHKAFDQAVDTTSATMRPVVDLLIATAHDAVDRLSQAAGSAAETMEMSSAYVRDAKDQAARSARGYVREKPLTSVGIALAAGYLLSWALRKH